MELRKDDWVRLNELGNYSDKLIESEPHWKQKALLQEDDQDLIDWISDVMAPSLLAGDPGVDRCLSSIEAEGDDVLTYLKTGLLRRWWGWFQDFTPAQVAEDLRECGFDDITVAQAVMRAHALNYDTPGVMENIFDILKQGDDASHMFEVPRPPTMH